MSDRKPDELLDASYDGIQEYDNDLPRWWLYLFIVTIVFAGVYTVYVHAMQTPSDEERLASEMKILGEQRLAFEQAHAPKAAGEDALLALVTDEARVSKGKSTFALRCAACHGQKAEGLVGPNLTDEYWLHGGKIDQIHATIVNGVLDKGMLSWKGILTPDEIDELAAFIWSVRNTNVPGKAPQGEKS